MRIKSIHLYPVKSLGGMEVASATITEMGFQHDRRWMIVDENLEFVTQRTFPQMALVDVAIHSDHLSLRHRTGEFSALRIPFLPATEEILRVKVWSSTVKAMESSPEASKILSAWLGMKLKLVYMPDDANRIANPRVVRGIERVSFADGYPYLLIGQGSLDDLNSKLETPVPMDRFRPNMVVEGSLPFAEDGWERIQIGDTTFRAVKPCARCVMTTVDQSTGEKGKEPLRTLAGYRTSNGKVMFGQNLICESGAEVRVGDLVTPL